MTLDEAINHCDEKAEELERRAEEIAMNDAEGVYQPQVGRCRDCASEHRQLAEWLKELKKYRIAHWKLRDMDYEYDFNSMFGDNPMYYAEKVWDLFGAMYASVEYEVMGYEEVNADDNDGRSNKRIERCEL